MHYTRVWKWNSIGWFIKPNHPTQLEATHWIWNVVIKFIEENLWICSFELVHTVKLYNICYQNIMPNLGNSGEPSQTKWLSNMQSYQVLMKLVFTNQGWYLVLVGSSSTITRLPASNNHGWRGVSSRFSGTSA